MGYTKDIVCLANSRKPPSGRCIAGREWDSDSLGPWIRPVSGRPTQEISEEERRYQDGADPRVLDIITISLAGPRPHLHQQENQVIDDRFYWRKRERISWDRLLPAIEDPAGPLWMNGDSSSHGRNDRVAETMLGRLTRSLYLVRPDGITLIVATEGGDFGPPRRRVRVRFRLCGESYTVVVTDPWIEERLLRGNDGEFRLAEALVCMSLGEVFHGYAYKLAASIITPKRAGRGVA